MLSELTLPDGLTAIGQYAFEYDKKLITLTIPASVVTIEKGAFYYWTKKQTITIEGKTEKPDTWDKCWVQSECTLVWNG